MSLGTCLQGHDWPAPRVPDRPQRLSARTCLSPLAPRLPGRAGRSPNVAPGTCPVRHGPSRASPPRRAPRTCPRPRRTAPHHLTRETCPSRPARATLTARSRASRSSPLRRCVRRPRAVAQRTPAPASAPARRIAAARAGLSARRSHPGTRERARSTSYQLLPAMGDARDRPTSPQFTRRAPRSPPRPGCRAPDGRLGGREFLVARPTRVHWRDP